MDSGCYYCPDNGTSSLSSLCDFRQRTENTPYDLEALEVASACDNGNARCLLPEGCKLHIPRGLPSRAYRLCGCGSASPVAQKHPSQHSLGNGVLYVARAAGVLKRGRVSLRLLRFNKKHLTKGIETVLVSFPFFVSLLNETRRFLLREARRFLLCEARRFLLCEARRFLLAVIDIFCRI